MRVPQVIPISMCQNIYQCHWRQQEAGHISCMLSDERGKANLHVFSNTSMLLLCLSVQISFLELRLFQ